MDINKSRFQKTINIPIYLWPLTLNLFCIAIYKNQIGVFHVLLWTKSDRGPFGDFSHGFKSLILMNCVYQNCYITDNKTYFQDLIDFDVILFNSPDINNDMQLPPKRYAGQLYVFVSVESESNFPISEKFNNFFNYTWSYKLNSDIPYPYFFVRKKRTGEVIAPKRIVHWKRHKKMKATPKSVIERLQNKSICAAWFVTNCRANNLRLYYVRRLRSELQKLGHQIDIFGTCDANKQCPRNVQDCHELLKMNYFFYLSFENSFSEDYVTEKLLTAVNNFAVPVVYGGANYSRFLPDGAYLNSRMYDPSTLATMMNDMINNKTIYYDYFKFYRYYTYHTIGESEDIDPLCTLCKFLNNYSVRHEGHVYEQFDSWWHENSMKVFKKIRPTTESAYEKFLEEHPEFRETTTTPGDPNMILDIINYFFGNSK